MRKLSAVLLCVLLMGILGGCGSNYNWTYDAEEELERVDLDSVEVLYNIRITAGDTVLSGVLYDNQTAREFAEMLPLTTELWHPAPDFARAFDLPERIPRCEKSGYEYELGSLAYWYEGPSVALIYQASREKTVVPVVPIGRITSDVSVFQEYDADITIEMEENTENSDETQ